MSIIGSMFTAQTAIDAFGDYMGIAGDNIANLNTVGFKTSRQSFADLLPTVDGHYEVGHGVRLAAVSRPFQQGSIETTNKELDLAVQGNGYFVVKDSAGGTFYTRAGQFQVDKDYNVVNPAGLLLQGQGGNISLATAATIAATPTSQLEMNLVLDSSKDTPLDSFPLGPVADKDDFIRASNFPAIVQVYDDAGESHDVTFYFRKSAPNTWDYRVAGNRSEMDASAPDSDEAQLIVGAEGQLVFTQNGQFDASASTVANIPSVTWVDGSETHTTPSITFSFTHTEDLTDPVTGAVTQIVVGLNQYRQASEVRDIQQDGTAQGLLSGLHIGIDGVIAASYSNGATQVIDTVILADFPNVDDLERLGNTLFGATLGSGAAVTGVPGEGGRGTLLAGGLEVSTVDLATEFVTMLISQRAFQVNSKVITTADEMWSVAADLKR